MDHPLINAADQASLKVQILASGLSGARLITTAWPSRRVAGQAGHAITLPFTPGRTDAMQEQTDVPSFAPLEPVFDGFRNYAGAVSPYAAEELLGNRANLLTLSEPEMAVLVGGLRVLGTNHGDTAVWTEDLARPGAYIARDRATGEALWTGTRGDLIFGSNSQLRALAEAYATDDAAPAFVEAFAAAWGKVMHLGL